MRTEHEPDAPTLSTCLSDALGRRTPGDAAETSSVPAAGAGGAGSPAPAAPSDGDSLIHPALHIDPRVGVYLGLVTEKGKARYITPRGAADNASHLAGKTLHPYAVLAGRWPSTDVEAFLADGQAPPFEEALGLLLNIYAVFVEWPKPAHAALLATWTLATYFHPLFRTFPRLVLVGEKGSGKSKVLTILGQTAWNALFLVDVTPPTLFRLIEAYKPTLLLDEMENLTKGDGSLKTVIRSGYKAGATVPRVRDSKAREVDSYHVYGPMAVAGIKGMDDVTEDRSIPLALQPGLDHARTNREVDVTASIYATTRAACYRLLLVRWHEVRDAYQAVAIPDWLAGRARELWRPLLAVASLMDQEIERRGSEQWSRFTPQLLALAKAHVKTRDTASPEAVAMLRVLTARLSAHAEVLVRPAEVTEGVQIALGWEHPPNPRQIANLLRRLGFDGARDRQSTYFRIHADQLTEARARFGVDV